MCEPGLDFDLQSPLDPLRSGWRRLPFQLQRQLRPHLCWAAVASAVAHFYAPERCLSQEELVARAFEHGANRFWYADQALIHAGVYRDSLKRPLTFPELAAEIHRQRIVVVRIWWEFGGGHLVAVSGVSDHEEVAVEDPLYGSSEYPYLEFTERYRGWGSWSKTYLTQPGSGSCSSSMQESAY